MKKAPGKSLRAVPAHDLLRVLGGVEGGGDENKEEVDNLRETSHDAAMNAIRNIRA